MGKERDMKQERTNVVNNIVILNLIQDLPRFPFLLINSLRGRYPAARLIKFRMTALYNKGAFTLIELLVVVLIIGILAAIAVPQYQKAVERTKATEAITMLKSVYQAAKAYELENGDWPTTFADLSVSVPWTGTTKWFEGGVTDVLSDKNWSLQINNYSTQEKGVNIGQISGKYTGGGFVIWNKYSYSSKMLLHTILCAEVTAKITTPGAYCKKIMRSGEELMVGGVTLRYYKM